MRRAVKQGAGGEESKEEGVPVATVQCALEKLLRKHVQTAEQCNFICRYVVPIGIRPGQILPFETAIGTILLACCKDPRDCTRLFQLLQRDPAELLRAVEMFVEMQTKARKLAELYAKPESALPAFGGIVADMFPDEQSVLAYLNVHGAPYETLNELRAALVSRQWNLGAIQDRSDSSGLGYLGVFARTMYHVCLGLDIPKEPYRLQVI